MSINTNNELSKIQEIKNFIKPKLKSQPKIAIVLGSGLGDFAHQLKDTKVIPYAEIPHFSKTTVAGHAGEFIIGNLGATPILCMKGRFHYYEGHSLSQVVLPIRVLAQLGIKKLILTNAAGGINTRFQAGDLMAITDHINLTGTNPLIGPNISECGPRFPDMSEVYTPKLLEVLEKTAADLKISLHSGVYIGTTGPSYETPAEIRMYRNLGADAVGMSTVSEAITAAHCGMHVCGLSCITNLASGMSPQKLTHEEVMEISKNSSQKMTLLLSQFVENISHLE